MPTFGEFGERFLAEYCVPPRIKPRTVRLYADNVRRLAEPFHNMKLDSITKAELHDFIGALARTGPRLQIIYWSGWRLYSNSPQPKACCRKAQIRQKASRATKRGRWSAI